ncbi:hypothetical protein CLV78_1263 [Aliiruegeria haliotis]|uniref:Uncharacterized protein n=1 Tax=Aliiruegeria haliotis TaxID=1280846 RepID=A0A2T0RDK8_9RHOB|nr:hypothetical protein [Aliiruegeria haliotis]PRY19231.1 hypothetical protein CLV78_1263 [Aliiruegeria haliotis]
MNNNDEDGREFSAKVIEEMAISHKRSATTRPSMKATIERFFNQAAENLSKPKDDAD